MSAYQSFTSARQTDPDAASLLALLRALDPTAGVQYGETGQFVIKKATAWTAPQIATAQTVIDTAPATSPALSAQAQIDNMPVFEKAILLALLDQINTIRGALVPPLSAITPAQALSAVRTKAGQL